MTAVAYTLGKPPAPAQRGGDCRARDLTGGRNVHGPHRFAAATDCQISNGLLRLTVGATGASPALTVEGWRGPVTVGDVYADTYADTYSGSIGTPAWLSMGALTIDSPSVSALLTGVQLVRVGPVGEYVIIRLLAPLIGDAFVVLEQGERQVHIQHGTTRPPIVTTTRRIRWTASPSPTGYATTNLVQELPVGIDGFPRVVSSLDPTTPNAGVFSLTSPSVAHCRFGAGVGTYADRDGPDDMRPQLGDTSRGELVVQTA